jgi:biotin carboxyl carrier protein
MAKVNLLLGDEIREVELSNDLADAEVTDLGGGAFIVHTPSHSQEVFVNAQGTYSDGNSIDDLSLEVLSSRDLLIRERFAASVMNGKSSASGPLIIKAPMPGLVRAIMVAVGDLVEEDVTLLILEAMKMENNIAATGRGHVKSIFVEPGTSVDKNARLIELERVEQ